MLVYLSKKIAIPNQVKLHCISWNKDQGWIACGGDAGLLKVLKLEALSTDSKSRGMAAPTNLSMNQPLSGHSGAVICLAWNPCYQKLTTSDENGLIIVWGFNKGVWFEEMINNREKSFVKDMKWSSDGKKICIAYEDGTVIVGGVDGSRIWGRDICSSLSLVEWSPDGKFILFCSGEGEIFIHDSEGNKIKPLSLMIGNGNSGGDSPMIARDKTKKVVTLEWYDGKGSGSSHAKNILAHPSLCIAVQGGFIQLNRGMDDANPVLFNCQMTIHSCRWNADGTILSVIGFSNSSDGVTNYVKFYTNSGVFVRTLIVPGEEIKGLTWENTNLRIAMAVDAAIFFANNRPSYMWAYLQDTVIYTRPRPDKNDCTTVFWDLTTGEYISKNVANLKFVKACGDFCVFAIIDRNVGAVTQTKTAANTRDEKESKNDDIFDGKTKESNAVKFSSKTSLCSLQLRNAVGAIIDVKTIPFVPTNVSMSAYHIVAANERVVYIWQYSSGSKANSSSVDDEDAPSAGGKKGVTMLESRGAGKEKIFDIESIQFASPQSPETFTVITEETSNPITAVVISDKFLVVAQSKGQFVRFTLPHFNVENSYQLPNCVPLSIALNCTSSRLSVIDESGTMTVLDLEVKVSERTSNAEDSMAESKDGEKVGAYYGKKLNIERRDVWDMIWAEDNEEMLCVMEKTKLIIMRGENAEPPVQSSGYLGRFKNLEVRSVNLDDLLLKPEQPERECVTDYESKDLRELRELIITDGVNAGYNFANANPHPKLWKLIAEKALDDLDLIVAEKAFVRCENYYGIQLVKQLKVMSDKNKAKAEVAIYLGRFDEAESIYRGIDRKDLALQMRNRIGDFARVVQLLQTGGGSDKLIRQAWDRMGDYYSDRFKWSKAVSYYKQSNNYERLADCYYRLQMFTELSDLATQIPDGTALLTSMATMFESVGMYESAVSVYIRNNNPRGAVDCCILQNRWDKALELAEQYDFPQTESLLQRYAGDLITKKKWLEAVELYRQANRPTEAAILLGEIAERVANRDVKPSLAKKLHILAALEVERHRKRTMDAAGGNQKSGATVAQTTAATLETLMMTSLEANATTTTLVGATVNNTSSANKTSKSFANAWRGAAAYHFFMLAQKQFYGGQMDPAMKTAIKLCEYDDILSPKDIYSLLALTAYQNGFFNICSLACVKLETLPNLSENEKEEIETLAVKIFSMNAPSDPTSLPEPYVKCLEVNRSYKACIITGRAILESPATMCKTCRHLMLDNERPKELLNCPLCHTEIR